MPTGPRLQKKVRKALHSKSLAVLVKEIMICQISKKSFLDDFSFWSFAMLKRLKKKIKI